MVETWLMLGGGAVIVFAGSVIGGMIAGLLSDFARDMKTASFEARLKRLENAGISSAGVAAREAKATRQGEALAEAFRLFKENKSPADIVKELGPKYPDVALDLIMKSMKNDGLKGMAKLGDFLG